MAVLSEDGYELFSYSEDPWKPATSHEDFRIRLIELYPSGQQTPAAPLQCRLFWTPVTTDLRFQALSYTWGADPPSEKITVHNRFIPITPSLEIALQHIRHESEPVTLWIDQMSINQSDDAEKSEQVTNMHRIYQAASNVIVGLGPAADGSDEVLDTWNRISEMAADIGFPGFFDGSRPSDELLRIITNADPQDPTIVEFHRVVDRVADMLDGPTLKSWAALERRPWFSRIWVVQEFALAKRAIFMCGRKTIHAKPAEYGHTFAKIAIGRLSPGLRSLFANESDHARALFNIRRTKEFDTDSQSVYPLYFLLRLLYTGNDMYATEACDHIFALLGLSGDAEDLGIRVDYALKDRVDHIFARTTKAIIASENLEILAMAQHPKHRSELPSWVPDFTNRIDLSFVDHSLHDITSFTLFNASGGHRVELLGIAAELELGLTGFIVDEVEETRDVWDGGEDWNDPEDVVRPTAKLSIQVMESSTSSPDETRQGGLRLDMSDVPYAHGGFQKHLSQIESLCERSAQKNNDIYPSAERRAEAVWRVPIGDLENTNFVRMRASTGSATAYRLCKRSFDFLDGHQSLATAELRKGAATWEEDEATRQPGRYRARMYWMRNKRPFMTREGYVGMGPHCMEAGDLIVVLGGTALPYVAQTVDREARKYLLVGECYCDGIMDGEIVDTRPVEMFFFM